MVQFPAMRDTIKVRVTRAIKGVNDDETVIVDSFRGACEEGAVAAFKSESVGDWRRQRFFVVGRFARTPTGETVIEARQYRKELTGVPNHGPTTKD
jgi:hypothetical protein